MGYQDGVAAAESRLDWWGKKTASARKQASCDKKYGWKRGTGGKCVRLSPQEDVEQAYGTEVFLNDQDKKVFTSFWEKMQPNEDFTKGVRDLTDPPLSREKAIRFMRDYSRVDKQYSTTEDGWVKETSKLKKFYKDPKSLNKYGTGTYLSGKEENFIENTGGLGGIPSFSKDKEINYLRDVYMTTSKYSKNPQAELDKVNKHYFGE